VEKALELKGIPYSTVELMPTMHVPLQQLRFGKRTVPGIKLEDGEKVIGSRAIVRRLDELAPDPSLRPAEPELRAKVDEAERWGDEVLQPIGRRLLWPALRRRPEAGASYLEHSKLPIPDAMARLSLPVVTRIECRINAASDEAARADLAALPDHLDRVDGYIADGVMGANAINAADLQIAPTIRLLLTIADVRPLVDGRQAEQLARRLFPQWDGNMPAGALAA
jgi:glutathione S-transferase